MEHAEALAPVDVIAQRVRETRNRKGFTAEQLAVALKARGLEWDRQTVTKLETGRRQNVSVVEWLTLSRALDVSPLHLLVPLEEVDFWVTPGEAMPASRVRSWVRGSDPLPGTDERIFRSEVPLTELPSSGRLTSEGRGMADAIRARYREVTGQEADDDTVLDLMTGVKKMPGGTGDGE